MKNALKFIAAVLISVSTSSFVNAQKIAHIDLDSLIQLMPEYNAALQTAQDYYKQLENQMVTMQGELQTAYQKYVENEKNYNDLIKKTEQEKLNDMQKRIEDFRAQAQTDYQSKQANLTKPLYEKAKKAIDQVAKESGYKFVLDTSSGVVIYSEPTDDILQLVKKKLGVTGTPTAAPVKPAGTEPKK